MDKKTSFFRHFVITSIIKQVKSYGRPAMRCYRDDTMAGFGELYE